jgi:hypothetical protein
MEHYQQNLGGAAMNRHLTYAEFWFVQFLTACCVLAVVLLCNGCATKQPDIRRLRIESCTLVLACQERVQEEWDKHSRKIGSQDVTGFYDPFLDEIWCTVNEDGMPDFWTLGHEVWHQNQLGGQFHK